MPDEFGACRNSEFPLHAQSADRVDASGNALQDGNDGHQRDERNKPILVDARQYSVHEHTRK